MDIERQTLSIMKACEVVGVSRRTIYNWMAGGKVQYVRTAGGSVRIFADSLWRTPQETDNSADSALTDRVGGCLDADTRGDKMHRRSYSVADLLERGSMEQPRELRQLFHQLNNQLGIILAHAELLEKKAPDETSRARATQVVSSVLDAMGTAKEIRMQMGEQGFRSLILRMASRSEVYAHVPKQNCPRQSHRSPFPLPLTPTVQISRFGTVQNCNL